MPKPKVLLIFTGGTIAMIRKSPHDVLTPPEQPADLLDVVPQLRRLADIDISIVSNIDSSNLQPELWPQIAQLIVDTQHQYDGYVITHGTDTLAYTAAALSLFIDTSKPIICTGSQRPLVGDISSDAPLNLAHAVEAATLDIGEVCVAFGNKLFRGSCTHKLSEFHFDAFTSFDTPILAEFGVRTRLFNEHQPRRNEPIKLRSLLLDPRVAWLPVYPGMSPVILEQLLVLGIRGLYLQGYGAGNIPTLSRSLVPIVQTAVDTGVSVVIGTQCSRGGVETLYATGQAAFEAGVISAAQMTPEMAIVKLMWALGQATDREEIREIMEQPYAKELTLA